METEVLTTEENAFDELDFDESVELRALVRSLKRARNFTLLFARCNQRPRQRELIEQIKNELPDKNIEVVYFENAVSHFLDELKERLEGKTPDAVFVYGLENSLGYSATANKSRFVLSLNVSRNNFPQVVNCPVVFWLPNYGIKAIANGAPDFFSVRSGVYFFDTEENDAANRIEILTSGDFYESTGLSFDERQERISHIQNLLDEFQSSEQQRDHKLEILLLKFKLAQLFYISGQYDIAEQHFKELLLIAEKTNDLNLKGTLLEYLALIYRLLLKYEEAEPFHKESLQLSKQLYGKKHPNTATSYDNLGSLYEKLGKYELAETLLKKALHIREEVLGSDHPHTATSYNSLALFYESLEDYEKAEKLYEKALQINEKLLGKNHPNTAAAYNNLGNIYKLQGKYKEAKSMCLKALSVLEKTLGQEHPDTKLVRNNFELLKEEESFKQEKQ